MLPFLSRLYLTMQIGLILIFYYYRPTRSVITGLLGANPPTIEGESPHKIYNQNILPNAKSEKVPLERKYKSELQLSVKRFPILWRFELIKYF